MTREVELPIDPRELMAESIGTPVVGVHYIVDLYAVLGVDPDANEDDIKTAYRTAIRVYHPDRYVGTADEFADAAKVRSLHIIAAYGVLSDSVQRERFDAELADFREKGKPVSNDGTPIVEARMISPRTDQAYTFYESLLLRAAGHDQLAEDTARSMVAGLESLGPSIQDNPSLMTALQDARSLLAAQLRCRDEALAGLQESQARSLGVSDDVKTDIGFNYPELAQGALAVAGDRLRQTIGRAAIAQVQSQLALESGEVFTESGDAVLPVVVDEDAIIAAVTGHIAVQAEYLMRTITERDRLADERIAAIQMIYPVEQPELYDTLYIGIIAETDGGITSEWIGIRDTTGDYDFNQIEIDDRTLELLQTDQGISEVVQASANVVTINLDYAGIAASRLITGLLNRHYARYESADDSQEQEESAEDLPE